MPRFCHFSINQASALQLDQAFLRNKRKICLNILKSRQDLHISKFQSMLHLQDTLQWMSKPGFIRLFGCLFISPEECKYGFRTKVWTQSSWWIAPNFVSILSDGITQWYNCKQLSLPENWMCRMLCAFRIKTRSVKSWHWDPSVLCIKNNTWSPFGKILKT